jgi:hypothetical protein
MKQAFLFILLLFSATVILAQQSPRTILRGQVIDDNGALEGVTIYNITTNKGAVTDERGYFSLYARAQDTLAFSSVNMKAARLVLQENDFKINTFMVKLEISVNELDEVEIRPNALTGDLMKDERNLKVTMLKSNIGINSAIETQFIDDELSSPKNRTMLPDGSIENGMDFVKIGNMISSIFKKDRGNDEKEFLTDAVFNEAVKEKFTYHFFTNTLALNADEIGLFLAYCENDSQVKKLLAPNKEIELIDYLISQSKIFKSLPKE